MYNLPSFDSLKFTQKANMELSLVWKEQSFLLLSDAIKKNDSALMEEAIQWCGQKGHATQFLTKDEITLLANKICCIIQTTIIEKGFKLDYYEMHKELKLSSFNAYSWLSKICHVLNPNTNPLIYDIRTRKFLKRYTIDAWFDALMVFKAEHRDLERLSRNVAYKADSLIWAYYG